MRFNQPIYKMSLEIWICGCKIVWKFSRSLLVVHCFDKVSKNAFLHQDQTIFFFKFEKLSIKFLMRKNGTFLKWGGKNSSLLCRNFSHPRSTFLGTIFLGWASFFPSSVYLRCILCRFFPFDTFTSKGISKDPNRLEKGKNEPLDSTQKPAYLLINFHTAMKNKFLKKPI